MPIPAFKDFGPEVGFATAGSPNMPGTFSAGETIILYVATDGWTPTLSSPQGFQLAVDRNGVQALSVISGVTGMAIFWKRAVGNAGAGLDPAPTVAAPSGGGTCWCAHTNVYTSVRSAANSPPSGTPFHAITVSQVNTATTAIAPPSITTDIVDCLIGSCASSEQDDSGFNSWNGTGVTGASLDNGWHTSLGNACSWAGGAGGKATPGSGSLSSNFSISTRQGHITFALASVAEIQGTTSISGTSTTSFVGQNGNTGSSSTINGAASASFVGGTISSSSTSVSGTSTASFTSASSAAATFTGSGSSSTSFIASNISSRAFVIDGTSIVNFSTPASNNIALGAFGSARVLFGTPAGTVSVTLNTQSSGSTFILCVGGATGDFTTLPTDSRGNTWTSIGQVEYTDFPGYGIKFYRCINGSGGASHQFSQQFGQTNGFDECTICVVEMIQCHHLQAAVFTEVTSDPPHITPSITTQAPSIQVSFWGGDAPTGQTAVVSTNRLPVVDSSTLIDHPNGYVPIAIAAGEVFTTGTQNLTWFATPAQGAILFLAAGQEGQVSAGTITVDGTSSSSFIGSTLSIATTTIVGSSTTSFTAPGGSQTSISGTSTATFAGNTISSAVTSISALSSAAFNGTAISSASFNLIGATTSSFIGASITNSSTTISAATSTTFLSNTVSTGNYSIPASATVEFEGAAILLIEFHVDGFSASSFTGSNINSSQMTIIGASSASFSSSAIVSGAFTIAGVCSLLFIGSTEEDKDLYPGPSFRMSANNLTSRFRVE